MYYLKWNQWRQRKSTTVNVISIITNKAIANSTATKKVIATIMTTNIITTVTAAVITDAIATAADIY